MNPKPRPELFPFFRRESPSGVLPFRGPLPILPSKKCHNPLGFHETFSPEMKKKGMKSKRRGKERERKVKVEGAMPLINNGLN